MAQVFQPGICFVRESLRALPSVSPHFFSHVPLGRVPTPEGADGDRTHFLMNLEERGRPGEVAFGLDPARGNRIARLSKAAFNRYSNQLFLEAWRPGLADNKSAGIAPRVNAVPDLPRTTPTRLPQGNYRLGSHSLPRPPIGQTNSTWYRNINLLAIDYAFRPRLRTRLTLGRRALPRKPWTIGGGDSHPSFVTHAGILTSQASTTGFRRRFAGLGTLSYRAIGPRSSRTRSFGV